MRDGEVAAYRSVQVPSGDGRNAVVGQSISAIAAYTATGSRQLSFAKGDTFTVVKIAGPWYVARDGDGNEGLVPSNYVGLHGGGATAETSI